MGDDRVRVLTLVQACLHNLAGGSGHVASYRLDASSFELVGREPAGEGLVRVHFRVRGALVTEFTPPEDAGRDDDPGWEELTGHIVLTEALELTRDARGEVRIEPFRVLSPGLWSADDRHLLPTAWPEHEDSDADAWFQDLVG